jgi:acetyl esterase/lipase
MLGRRGPTVARRARHLAAVAVALLALVGCGGSEGAEDPAPVVGEPGTPVTVTGDGSVVGPSGEAEALGEPVEVAYGPDPLQTMDVHTSDGGTLGTIVYVHGGAWVGGSKDDAGSPGYRVVMAQRARGWDVVSIDYRLATAASGPGIRAPELLADVDRAVRTVRRDADALGLDVSTLVIAGGSAGGHLALLHAQGFPTDEFADADLPEDLAAVPATVDAVVAVVAPTDLHTEWMSGGVAPGGQEALLGCTLAEEATLPGMAPCDPALVDEYSPLWWSRDHVASGRTLLPAYFAYGGQDTLVQAGTQGTPNVEAWAAAAEEGRTWFDLPPSGGHDLDDDMNGAALDAWFDAVASGRWDLAADAAESGGSGDG